MGWPPAVVIVVRHGARLDAADKQWHLTSPTPYDPPLTYGGWTQSRALGSRIASILRSRETDDEQPGSEGGEEQKDSSNRKRRHKVIIHSSPFLRCVQTSVAISAGLAQSPGHASARTSTASPALKPLQMHSSPSVRPTLITGSPALAPIPEPACTTLKPLDKSQDQSANIRKSTIRIDAFLGEWLSPDYFELITPPPSSIMMVAGAKADLLRREDYSYLSQSRETTSAVANQGFPGGWGSPVVLAEKDKDESALSTLPSLAQALPRRDRTSSLSSVGSSGSRISGRSNNASLPLHTEHGLYQIPVPNYAISGLDPIPPGYVAHARDACVDVDYQWDSMREPQNWGNGGEYGEEWSSMHKRFRKGLQDLISWYQNTDDPGRLLTKVPSGANNLDDAVHEATDNEDTDLIIILVTHGAGCNALIGALTNQPVLLDVGMSSLTMAVRKPTPINSPTSTPGHSRANSRNLSLSEQYDVKLVASTDHLRSTSGTPTISRAPSVTGLFRERFSNGNAFGPAFRENVSRSPTTNPNFGSIRRAASVAASGPKLYNTSRQSSIGLWSAPKPPTEEAEEESDDMILNFGNDGAGEPKPVTVESVPPTKKETEEVLEEDNGDKDDVGPLGLWGSPRPPDAADKNREIAPKRRWTVNEREMSQ